MYCIIETWKRVQALQLKKGGNVAIKFNCYTNRSSINVTIDKIGQWVKGYGDRAMRITCPTTPTYWLMVTTPQGIRENEIMFVDLCRVTRQLWLHRIELNWTELKETLCAIMFSFFFSTRFLMLLLYLFAYINFPAVVGVVQ